MDKAVEVVADVVVGVAGKEADKAGQADKAGRVLVPAMVRYRWCSREWEPALQAGGVAAVADVVDLEAAGAADPEGPAVPVDLVASPRLL